MRRPWLLLCLALAACGGSTQAAVTSSSTRTVTKQQTVTTQPTVTTKAATAAKPASGGVAYCSPKDLGIHYVGGEGAAGTELVRFAFVNVTSHPCRLHGYPGVSVLTAAGRRISLPVSRRPSEQGTPRVTVRPGQRVGFTFATLDGMPPCYKAGIFRFIPPNDFGYEQIAHQFPVCRVLEVTPVGTR